MKYTLLAAALAAFVMTACEGKKSLDGYPMDKPPPSAYGARDSEPVFPDPVDQEDEVVEAEDAAAGKADDEREAAETGSEETVDETDELEDESDMSEDEEE